MSKTSLIPTQEELKVLREYVEIASSTGKYRHFGRDGSEKGTMLLILLTARELGVPLMGALNGGVQIVKGKTELSVHMKTYKILQGGNTLKSWYSEDGKTCFVTGVRKDSGFSLTESFSLDDAKRAGLTGNDSWRKYPKEMLYARALSRVSNKLFPDVVGGQTYAYGEIDPDGVDPDIAEIGKGTKGCELLTVKPDEECDGDAEEDVGVVTEESEIIDDETLDTMVYRLYSLFPGEDGEFAKFVGERAESAGVSAAYMYRAMYNNIDAVAERFAKWKGAI
jgi:hypothetical protein